MFKITSVYRYCSETVMVCVNVDAKEWSKLAKSKDRRGALGSLYATDISNAAFREYGVHASTPSVCDTRRAKRGVKRISLVYRDAVWQPKPPVELDTLVDVEIVQSFTKLKELSNLDSSNNVVSIFQNNSRPASDESSQGVPCEVIHIDFINKRRVAA